MSTLPDVTAARPTLPSSSGRPRTPIFRLGGLYSTRPIHSTGLRPPHSSHIMCDSWRASTLADMWHHLTFISWPRHHACVPRHPNLWLSLPLLHYLPASRSLQRLSSDLTCYSLSVRLLAAFSFLACSQCARCCCIWPPRAAQPPRLRLAATRDTRPASPPPPWPSPSHYLALHLPYLIHPPYASGSRVLHTAAAIEAGVCTCACLLGRCTRRARCATRVAAHQEGTASIKIPL